MAIEKRLIDMTGSDGRHRQMVFYVNANDDDDKDKDDDVIFEEDNIDDHIR